MTTNREKILSAGDGHLLAKLFVHTGHAGTLCVKGSI